MQFNVRDIPEDVHHWLKVEATIRKLKVYELAVEVLTEHAQQFQKKQESKK